MVSMMVKKSFLVAVIIAGSFMQPVNATPLDEGAKLYQQKQYDRALPLFEKAVKTDPASWQAHYYLANTYLTLGKVGLAKYQYQCCLQNCTDAGIRAQCQTGVTRADQALAAQSAAQSRPAPATTGSASASSVGSTASGGTTGASSNSAALANKASEIAWRREAVMRLAREDVARTRAEFKAQLEHEKATSQTIYRHADGHLDNDISVEREDEIKKECEEKCKYIMDTATKKAAGIN